MTESQKKVIMVLSVVGERGRVIMQPVQPALLDFFGSVKVYVPQDFNAVRKQALAARAERGK